jgi:SM-20-related protein
MTNFIINSALLDTIADTLVKTGIIVIADFLPKKLTSALYNFVTSLPDSEFKQAGIGRQNDLQLNTQIRSDQTRWLNQSSEPEQAYLIIMEQLRHQLNERLFLGLKDYESHFAHYAIGSQYHQHLDAFQGQSNRIVTSVFYLNPDWTDNDGGQLVVFNPENQQQETLRILPSFGTLVLFLSERFPHEVLIAQRERYSISGWFRIDKPLIS